jgi:hypothetical protein
MTVKTYTLTPLTGASGAQIVDGFRAAIAIAREIAEREHTTVVVRNEADCHTWHVAFRVRNTRALGPITSVEVTR